MTHYYAAVRAAVNENWAETQREIREAERRGLSHDTAERLLRTGGVGWKLRVSRYFRYAVYLLCLWMIGLAALFVAGKLFTRATLKAINSSDPDTLLSPGEHALRRAYRALIRLAGVYYYVSLPFVIALVLGTTTAIVYGFLATGRIPLQLILMLAVGACVTTYKAVQSLFVRIPSEDPGRALTVDEAPGLWALTREVAAAVGTRPIDAIRITPGTDVAVYERGHGRDRSSESSQRILVLGLGVMNGFRATSFRAVLAHEYGHFANRDTAGGEIALRVRQDMMHFVVAIARKGQAVWWNIAFQFLRLYDLLFRRISHGATRLQEVLADRVAAMRYGPASFEDGLRHVIRRSIEFNLLANGEIADAVRSQRQIRNFYTLAPPADFDIEEAVAAAINRHTTEDDSHPSPLDRFSFVRRVHSDVESGAEGLVWELFANPDSLTNEMTSAVASRVRVAAVPSQD